MVSAKKCLEAPRKGSKASMAGCYHTVQVGLCPESDLLADQEGLSESEADSLRQAGRTVIDSLKAVEEHWAGPLDPPQGISESETVLGKIGIAPFRFSSVAWYAPNQEERQRLAEELTVPFLGEVPLEQAVRETGDTGKPIVLAEPESRSAEAFGEIARRAVEQVHLRNAEKPPTQKVDVLYR